MAKVIKDSEMLDIVRKAVEHPSIIDDADQYQNFLRDLAKLITDHFGGEPSAIGYDSNDGLGWTVCFNINSSVPDDGGVFADYDTDVIWRNCVEVQR